MSAPSSTTTPILEYKVPRLLWENMEAILLAQSRRYIGDLARRLNVPEKELQRKVLPSSDSLKVMMMDSQAETTQCRAYVQLDSITTHCRKPIAYHSEFCAFHRDRRMNVFVEDTTPRVEKVKASPTKEPVWLRGNMLVNAKGETVGRIHPQRQIVQWFVLTEEKDI
jgi:hypothetical protein